MLFKAVSNWLASAASRSRAISARTYMLLQARRNVLQGEEEQDVQHRHPDIIGTCHSSASASVSGPQASSICTWKIHGRP